VPAQAANGPGLPPGGGPLPLAVALGKGDDRVRVRFKRPPRSALLFDLDSGEVLWRRNPVRPLPIASVTKLMTALLVAERLPPGTRVRVTAEARARRGSRVGLLPRGRRVGVSALLHGLLLSSGNDAAIALAQRVSGTPERFVATMNRRARELRLRCTSFASPDGLDDRGRSCAYDLAALSRAVLDEPRLAAVVRRREAALPFPIRGGRLFLATHNPLLRARYPGALGLKTGYTRRAGRCFVGAARRGNRRLGVVLLHSPDPGRQATQLLDRGWKALGK
jgi:D-alanyl-D-alanine carboxypeptidase